MVYEELPFDVVVFVEDHAGGDALEDLIPGLQGFIEIGDMYRFVPHDILPNAGYAETAFVVGPGIS